MRPLRQLLKAAALASTFLLAPSITAAGLFTQPASIELSQDRAVLHRLVPLGQKPQDTFLFIAHPDHFQAAILHNAVFRNVQTGQIRPASLFLHHNRLHQHLREMVTVTHLGWMRHSPVGVVKVRLDRRYHETGIDWELAEYQLEVAITSPDQPKVKAAPEGPVLKRLLEAMLTDPRQLDTTARLSPGENFPGPTDWQPNPAASPNFPWLQIPIESEGVYTIDREWLDRIGLDSGSFKPADLSVYLDGTPIPVHVIGPPDGTFASGAQLLFHGRGSDSPETAIRTHYLGAPTESSPTWQQIRAGAEISDARLRMLHHAEKDTALEVAMGSFLSIRRMAWIWAAIEGDSDTEVTFDLPNWAEDQADTATLALHIFSTLPPNNRTAQVLIGLNENEPISARWSHERSDVEITVPAASVRRLRNRLTLRLPDQRGPRGEGGLFLDRIVLAGPGRILEPDLTGPTRLIPSGVGVHAVAGIRPNDLMVYSSQHAALLPITRLRGTASFHWPEEGGGEIFILDRTRLQRAPEGRLSQWSPLPNDLGTTDYLIITHPDFKQAAERLAEHHRQSGLSVSIHTSVDLYEWFGYGNLSAEAIRNFIAWSTRQPNGRGPETVLLIGDANADGRNVSRQQIPNYLPMRQVPSAFGRNGDQISTDSFYSWLNPGDELADIIVGRLSVTSAEEALAVVDKIIGFASGTSRYQAHLMAVADTGADFVRDLDELADQFNSRARKLYADDFPWEDNYYLPAHLLNRVEDAKVSPQFTSAIEQAFNAGANIAIFFGHGAPNLWGDQRFWFGGGTPNSDILRLQNLSGLPFVASFTCNNAVIDYPLRPWNICIAEDFMRHRDRGAIATFMPSGPGFLQHHRTLADAFLRSWKYAGLTEVGLIGELVRIAHQAQYRPDDHSRMFILLGDPLTQVAPWQAAPSAPMSAPPGSVTIQSAFRDGEALRWHLRLANNDLHPASIVVAAEWFDSDWRIVDKQRTEVQMEGRTATFVSLEPPSQFAAGSYQLIVRIEDGTAKMRAASLPSSEWRTLFLHGPPGRGAFLPSRPRLRPAARPGTTPQLEVDVINTTTEPQNFTIELLNGKAIIDQQRLDPLQPAASSTVRLALPADLTPGADATYTVRALNSDGLVLQTLRLPISHDQLPDLAIDQTSVRVLPERPSDGLTIFVDLIVANIGRAVSEPTPVGLYHAEDKDFANPLRDMTRRNQQVIPPLLPGEQHRIRLRWDPHSNAGPQSITAMIDPDRLQLESRRSNNSVTRRLDVRTKWQLKPGVLRLSDPSEDGSILLAAEVGNAGETEAQRVTVTFFSSQNQNDQTRLAEMTIDRVDASTTTTISHRWNIVEKPPFPDDRTPPSFTISLKGSQQRISSVGSGSQ